MSIVIQTETTHDLQLSVVMWAGMVHASDPFAYIALATLEEVAHTCHSEEYRPKTPHTPQQKGIATATHDHLIECYDYTNPLSLENMKCLHQICITAPRQKQ